jgi:hypothetical protein
MQPRPPDGFLARHAVVEGGVTTRRQRFHARAPQLALVLAGRDAAAFAFNTALGVCEQISIASPRFSL